MPENPGVEPQSPAESSAAADAGSAEAARDGAPSPYAAAPTEADERLARSIHLGED
jgi:hypothetical protein